MFRKKTYWMKKSKTSCNLICPRIQAASCSFYLRLIKLKSLSPPASSSPRYIRIPLPHNSLTLTNSPSSQIIPPSPLPALPHQESIKGDENIWRRHTPTFPPIQLTHFQFFFSPSVVVACTSVVRPSVRNNNRQLTKRFETLFILWLNALSFIEFAALFSPLSLLPCSMSSLPPLSLSIVKQRRKEEWL